jgi:pilus assembly protein CpaC
MTMLTTLPAPRIPLSARALLFAGLLASALAVAPAPAFADTSHLRLTQASFGSTQQLSIDLNKSVIVDLPVDVKEVIVGQPSVAPTIMRSKRRAIIQGGAAGSTNIFFLDGAGQTISVIDLSVLDTSTDSADAASLTAALQRLIPGSHIVVEAFGERVVLSGSVRSGEDLAKATAIATQFTGDASNLANLITVGGGQQVMLKVTVAEVNRDALRQFGINLSGSLTVGNVSLGFNNTQTSGTNGIAGSLSVPNLTINAALRALENRGAVHTLAEPTLTAMSGQPAEFLVGGEFPVAGTDNNGNATTQFKQYGVNLNFTPTVKSNGQILLLVDTSVSEPANGGAVTERSAKTTVELGAGETLSIAGIFQDSVRQQINQMPGLGDIPILGALFRSREFEHRQTELVILVTPYIAQTGRPTLPTEQTTIATDAQAIFLGRMENNYGVGRDKDGLRTGYNGSVGFILD